MYFHLVSHFSQSFFSFPISSVLLRFVIYYFWNFLFWATFLVFGIIQLISGKLWIFRLIVFIIFFNSLTFSFLYFVYITDNDRVHFYSVFIFLLTSDMTMWFWSYPLYKQGCEIMITKIPFRPHLFFCNYFDWQVLWVDVSASVFVMQDQIHQNERPNFHS